MPSANGVYSLPVGYLAVTGQTIQASQHNPPLEDIAAALTGRLSRDGTAPMTGPLQATTGLVGAPSYTFQNANSTGFYKSTNGIGISVGGVLVAEITATGVPIADQGVTYPKIQAPSAPARLLGSNNNAALSVTAASNAAGLIRLTVSGTTAAYTTGQKKIVAGVGGTTEANGRWTITVVDTTHIDLQGSAFVNAYTSGGTIGGGVDELKLGGGLSLSGDTINATIDPTLVPGFLSGLTLSTAGASSTFGVAAGVANDVSQGGLMKLSGISKSTASWVVGNNQGGLDTGTIASGTWYHVYLIERTDTGVVDVLFSLSASSPTLPTNYTLFRRIGSLKTDGSAHWIAFTQTGDTFIWSVSVHDIANAGISTSRSTQALTVPLGVVVTALFRAVLTAATGTDVLITSLLESDQAASGSLADISVPNGGLTAGNFERLISTGQAIGYRADTTQSSALNIYTYGWKDSRGK